MVNAVLIRSLIAERVALSPNHPGVIDYWDKIAAEFKAHSLSDVIAFLNSCTADELGWISEVVDELLHHFEAPMMDFLVELDRKYPEADIGSQL